MNGINEAVRQLHGSAANQAGSVEHQLVAGPPGDSIVGVA